MDTRERPKIDRIACPLLILRFIDPEPGFLYVPAGDVLRMAAETGAFPYDIPGVELSHEGDLCSFDAFLKKYGLTDPALHHLGLSSMPCTNIHRKVGGHTQSFQRTNKRSSNRSDECD